MLAIVIEIDYIAFLKQCHGARQATEKGNDCYKRNKVMSTVIHRQIFGWLLYALDR